MDDEHKFRTLHQGVIPIQPVLDHGFVRLVDYMGSDKAIVEAARVSYHERWKAGLDEGSDERLLRYLWKNKHTSPFEAVTLKFEVKAPIFIFRQWHRHRTWSYNELSARYRELPEEFYLPDPGVIGTQAKKNKQGREGTELLTGADLDLRRQEVSVLEDHCKEAFKVYRLLLNADWPRELARSALPVNTYSHMEATVNLLNLFRFLTLRADAHAQWEMQQYAHAMIKLAKYVVPTAVAAWEESR